MIHVVPWDTCDTCRELRDAFCPSVCYLYITYHSYRYSILFFWHLAAPCSTLQHWRHLETPSSCYTYSNLMCFEFSSLSKYDTYLIVPHIEDKNCTCSYLRNIKTPAAPVRNRKVLKSFLVVGNTA